MKTGLRYALCVVTLTATAWYEFAHAGEILKLSDSVRVNTSWVRHSLGHQGCLERARASLPSLNYFVEAGDAGNISVYGFKEGRTVLVRCDYQGVAFLVAAYREAPEQAVQTQIMKELMDIFK